MGKEGLNFDEFKAAVMTDGHAQLALADLETELHEACRRKYGQDSDWTDQSAVSTDTTAEVLGRQDAFILTV